MKRIDVVKKARSLLHVPYRHQGRDETGIDCVGLIIEIAKAFNYQYEDVEGYKRIPSAKTLLTLMRRNLEEIDLSAVKIADIYLMKAGFGIETMHTSLITNLDVDRKNGIEPTMIHAFNSATVKRVVEQPIEMYTGKIVKAFQFKGILD